MDVYSTSVEQYLDPNYMGQICTVGKNMLTPISAVNRNGENVLPQIAKVDGVFTSGINGIDSPSWNNTQWNTLTLDLGNLAIAKQIKLVVREKVAANGFGRPRFAYHFPSRATKQINAALEDPQVELVAIAFSRLRHLCRFEKGGYCKETRKDCAPQICPQIRK